MTDFSSKTVMLVASTGGHLEQLHRLYKSGEIQAKSVSWVTFDHEQSRSLLADQHVSFVPYLASRDWRGAFSLIKDFRKLIKSLKPDLIISTGAAVAVPAAIASRRSRTRFTYLESVSRFEGPSLSGKLVSLIPGVRTYTQHPRWSNKRWKKGPNILGAYSSETNNDIVVKKIFVSLGTIRPFRFDRAVDKLREIVPENVQVRVQFGSTTGEFGDWEAWESLPASKFSECVDWADAVIMHAGVGSTLNVLDKGKIPLLLVRSASHDEHVDDHQEQIAMALESQGLAVCPNLSTMTWEHITQAGQLRAVTQ